MRLVLLAIGLAVSVFMAGDAFYRVANNDCGFSGHVPCPPSRWNIRYDENGPYIRFYDQIIRPQYPGAWDR